uniref:ATP synthase F0 subunit 6 n=1 Tax=Clavinema parasiluri TaxID=332280 RepID=A0A9F2HGX3_9BILA|nr:ATP synthase F0 subunit 6 [Clavinema parasiluri]WAX01690.1 ATP synthase F0 subunit 6 [Clavinema parasiluri]
MVVLLLLVFFCFFMVQELGLVVLGLLILLKKFLGLVVGDSCCVSYNAKSLLYVVAVVFCFSFYHFLGYTEEVWCNIIFSGGLVCLSLLSMLILWLMSVRGSWSFFYGIGVSLHGGMSWWGVLSKFYHHVSTPLVMLLRVFMNFLIGQVGKWGIVVGGLGMGWCSYWLISSFFFLYELMVVVLQSFIFVILSYEVLGLMYPSLVVFSSGKVSGDLWVVILCVIFVLGFCFFG